MNQLPSVSGMQARRVFEKNGWIFKRQKGSHMVLTKAGFRATLSVPNHKTLKEPLLKRLIKDAGMTVEQFKEMLCFSSHFNSVSYPGPHWGKEKRTPGAVEKVS